MDNLLSARRQAKQVSNAEAVDRWMGDAVTPDPSDSPPTNAAAAAAGTSTAVPDYPSQGESGTGGSHTNTGTGTNTGTNSGSGTGSGTGSGGDSGGDNSNNSGSDSPRGAERTSPKTNGSSDSSNPRHVAEPEEGSNLFVSGLTPTVDDAVLYATFARFGAVISAKVMLRVSTGVSRGFGFVLFQTAAQAQAALEATQGTAIKGHGGRLQVSVSKHRGENLVAESRVVYLRNVPTGVFEDAARFEGFLAAFGKMERCVPRAESTAAMTHVIVTFGSVSAARKCVAGSHGKTPFPECGVALMAKMEEPQSLREQRLRGTERSARFTGGSAAGPRSSPSPAASGFDRTTSAPRDARHAQQHASDAVAPSRAFAAASPPQSVPAWPSSNFAGYMGSMGFMSPFTAGMPPAHGGPLPAPFGMPPFPGGPPMWAPGGFPPPMPPPQPPSMPPGSLPPPPVPPMPPGSLPPPPVPPMPPMQHLASSTAMPPPLPPGASHHWAPPHPGVRNPYQPPSYSQQRR